MVEKTEGWKDTCERYVAFLDIMGFKDRLQRDGHEKVKEMLESLHPTISTIEQIASYFSGSKKTATVKPVVFSDSIILVSSDKSESAFMWMTIFTQLILSNAIMQGIPIKGAIACGIETANFKKSLHFGKPLIDAHELQNELLLYGVVLHHSAEKSLTELKMDSKITQSVIKTPIPMKSGKIIHYIVDWTEFASDKDNNPIDFVTKLYNSVSGKPRKYVDNTIEFLDWLEKERAKQQKEKKS